MAHRGAPKYIRRVSYSIEWERTRLAPFRGPPPFPFTSCVCTSYCCLALTQHSWKVVQTSSWLAAYHSTAQHRGHMGKSTRDTSVHTHPLLSPLPCPQLHLLPFINLSMPSLSNASLDLPIATPPPPCHPQLLVLSPTFAFLPISCRPLQLYGP